MLYGQASVRSAIFYDLDDTTYFLDHTATGDGLKMKGNICID